MHINAMLFRPKIDEQTGEEHTEVLLVTSVDIGGWVPTFFVNQASSSGPRTAFKNQENGAIDYLKSLKKE